MPIMRKMNLINGHFWTYLASLGQTEEKKFRVPESNRTNDRRITDRMLRMYH